MRTATASLLFGLILASVFAWWTQPELPAGRAAWEWFGLPGLAAVVVAGCYGLAAALEHRPGWVNPPDRAGFEALTPERKLPVIRHARRLVEFLALEAAALMGLIQLSQYHASGSAASYLYLIAALVLGLAVSPVVMFVYIGRMQAEIKQQRRLQEEDR